MRGSVLKEGDRHAVKIELDLALREFSPKGGGRRLQAWFPSARSASARSTTAGA